VLFNTLIKGPRKLTALHLEICSLTGGCVPTLVTTLQDEHCKLVELSLGGNDIGDEGVRLLCDNALTKEHCKLTVLNLDLI
jgi:Ran GTPase-activating protein (RanGAP) involved in mRNA processing and transport